MRIDVVLALLWWAFATTLLMENIGFAPANLPAEGLRAAAPEEGGLPAGVLPPHKVYKAWVIADRLSVLRLKAHDEASVQHRAVLAQQTARREEHHQRIELEEENSGLLSDLYLSRRERNVLLNDLSNAREEIDRLQKVVSLSREENNGLANDLSNAGEEIDRLQKVVSLFREENNGLVKALTTCREDNNDLVKAVAVSKAENNDLVKAVDVSKAENNDASPPQPPQPYLSFTPYPAPEEPPSLVELRRWPSPHIPVLISGFYTPDNRRDIKSGLAVIESQTCIRFVTAEGNEEVPTNHVLITPGPGGCDAVPGYYADPGYVSVVHLHAPNCLTHVGHVVHEIMHVLGFYHEHQRLDRNSHIIVHYDNILQGHEKNFERVVYQKLGLPYDVASIMHYGPKGFCKDCTRPTISALHGEPGAERMGQRESLSVTDIARLNRLYGCEEYYLGFDLPGSMPYDPPPPPT